MFLKTPFATLLLLITSFHLIKYERFLRSSSMSRATVSTSFVDQGTSVKSQLANSHDIGSNIVSVYLQRVNPCLLTKRQLTNLSIHLHSLAVD